MYEKMLTLLAQQNESLFDQLNQQANLELEDVR